MLYSARRRVGVGKTTTSVALAETLSALFHKRVLVNDLHRQCNAATALIDPNRWLDLNEKGHTLASLIEAASDDSRTLFRPGRCPV